MDRNGEGNPQPEESSEGFEKYLNRQSDWLEKTKGNLMITATVIASMSFDVMISPPGGVWQSDGCPRKNEKMCAELGTAVFAKARYLAYRGMVISSTVSFAASMSVILIAISGFRLRNRWIMGILVIFMLTAVLCLSAAFFFAVALVQTDEEMIWKVLTCYLLFWFLLVLLVSGIHLIRFISRAIRSCRRFLRRWLSLTSSSAN